MILNLIFALLFIAVAIWIIAYAESKIDSPKEAAFFKAPLDLVKLIFKRTIIPSAASKKLFLMLPAAVITFAVALYAVIPIKDNIVIADLNIGVIYTLALLFLLGYSLILTGWSSSSRYALLGTFRLAGQLLIYIIVFGFILLSLVLSASSFNIGDIVEAQNKVWFLFPHFPLFIVFLMCMLVLTNRMPGDSPFAASEIGGGINAEYSGAPLALLLISQYAAMLSMSTLATVLFMGGWQPLFGLWPSLSGLPWLLIKLFLCVIFFIWVKAALPRYRYDQVMKIGYKYLVPASGLWFILTAITIFIIKE
ncbi:MAG: NADH-quinone oxidoreductase subunit H [Alphaproteobacteria bacterium]|nr:NADH-quinone oxidoreductase subunit H [Alphaproteobacteria bacterium]